MKGDQVSDKPKRKVTHSASTKADKESHSVVLDFDKGKAVCKCGWRCYRDYPYELRREAIAHGGCTGEDYKT